MRTWVDCLSLTRSAVWVFGGENLSSIARPAEKRHNGSPLCAAISSALQHRKTGFPRPERIASQLRLCQDTSDGTVVRYAPGHRAHLGLTRLVCPCLRLP